MSRTQMPVSEQCWSALSDARKPVARSTEMFTQLLGFLCGPKGQITIQLAHRRIERRAIIPPVVPEPASNDGIEHPGQIFDRLVTALWQFPATNDADAEGKPAHFLRVVIHEAIDGGASLIELLPLLVGSLNQAPRHNVFAPSLYRGLRRYYTLFRL